MLVQIESEALDALDAALDELGVHRLGTARQRAVERAGSQAELTKAVRDAMKAVDDILAKVRGAQRAPGSEDDEARPSIQQRINRVNGEIGSVNSPATPQQRETLDTAARELDEQKQKVNDLTATTMPALRAQLDKAGVSWTPGRRIQ